MNEMILGIGLRFLPPSEPGIAFSFE